MPKTSLLLGLSSSILVLLLGAAACTQVTSSEGDAGPQQADASPDAPAQPDGGNDASVSDGGFFTGPIAPECTERLGRCAQVEVDALLACKDVDSLDYTITTRVSGKIDSVACGVEETGAKDGSSHDLWLSFQPPQADTEAYNTHAVQFWLADYKGPGTYALESIESGDYRNRGIWFQGATGGSQAGEKSAAAGSDVCKPSPCRAIVKQESEPIPHDPYQVQEFRVRVEVQCNDGGELWTHPDCNAKSRCTLQGAPTLKFDAQCTH